jgi:TnpA family transposase
MPVNFLTPEQIAQYGHYAGEPSPRQLAKHFHLDDGDREIIATLRGQHSRLGFAIQLCTVRFLGCFLSDLTETPPVVVEYLATQLSLNATGDWKTYVASKTQSRHRQFIRDRYGYEEFHQSWQPFSLMRQLYARTSLTQESHLVLFDYTTAWLVQHKMLLPGARALERWVARIVNRAQQRLWQRLVKLLTERQRSQLQSLLTVDDGERFSRLELLRRPATRASSPTIKHGLQRLEKVRTVGVSSIDLTGISVGHIKAMARYGLSAWAAAIDDLGENHRLALLLVTAHELEAVIQDEALDLLLLNVAQKFKDAEKAGLKARLKVLARVDAATLQLSAACQFVLNEKLPGTEVRQAIFKEIPREELEKAVALVIQETSIHAPLYYNLLTDGYRSIRLFLPAFLQAITFKGIGAGDDTILPAWQFLYQLDHGRPRPNIQEVPQEVVSGSAWRAVVYDQENQIDKRYYMFCVLQTLIAALERRDVFIVPSHRWQDQRAQLLQGDAWKKARPQICAALGKTADGEKEVKKLAKRLDTLYRQVAKRLARNKAVSIKKEDDHERIHLAKLKKVPEGQRLKELKEAVGDLMPELDLPDLLLEVHRLTGFADEFVHISEKQARATDLPLSICAVLLAEACNVGIDDVVNPSIPALRRSRLLWVQQNYIRDETLTHANARLVAAQAEIPLAQQWGGGHVASADGQRFKVPVESLMAAQNYKYFGEERGITYFTFTSDQFSSFFGIVIPGAVREALYILDGLLEQQTVLEPVEIMTDAAGYTDIVFGLFWLLGYQFSPRLRDIGKTRFWRFDKKARYGALGKVARHWLNEERMVNNWDDLLRVAGSLKLGLLTASRFMKTLQAGKGSSELAKAIAEVGRVAKTMYLLNYIDDADYRRRIMIQLNHGEQRHQLARAVFHGRRGQIWKKYREGQEDQLGALGLVVNMIVLWNTLYIQKALDYLRANGMDIRDEDVLRLTPLSFDHIRLTGRYNFTLTAKPESGGLRPLRRS